MLRTSRLRLFLVSLAVSVFVIAPISPTSATVSWYTFYNNTSSGATTNVWKNYSPEGQVRYNGGSTTTWGDTGATAYFRTSYGTAMGQGSVTTTFAYRGGKASCKWVFLMAPNSSAKGPLTCKTRTGY